MSRVRDVLVGPDTRFVLVHFILSRAIFLAGGLLTAMLLEGGGYAELLPLATSEAVLAKVRLLVENGDSGWYQLIMLNGYEAIPFSAAGQHNWAFFPLFPILMTLIGGSLWSGVVLANVFAFIAVRLLAHEVRDTASRGAARWTVLFILYYPFSGMLSTFRPESLLLLCAVLTWALARRGHWWLAWLAVTAATFSRSQGALVALLMLEPMWAQREQLRRSPWALLLGALLPLAALGAFSAYLGNLTGDPLAWAHIQAAWGRTGLGLGTLIDKYWPPLFVADAGWDFAFMNMVAIGLTVITSLVMLRARQVGFALFSLAWLAVPAVFGGMLISMTRYGTTLFPVFITLATVRALRPYRLMILLVMAGLLFGVGAWMSLELRAVMP